MADDQDPPLPPDGHQVPPQERSESPQLDALRAAGYGADFEVAAGGLTVRGSGPVDVGGLHIDAEYRFEGSSNPDDESLVVALHDPASDLRGVLITAYGPSASAGEAEVLATLAANPICADPAAPRTLA